MLFVVFVVLLYLACAMCCVLWPVAPKNGAKSGSADESKAATTNNDVMNQPMQGIYCCEIQYSKSRVEVIGVERHRFSAGVLL